MDHPHEGADRPGRLGSAVHVLLLVLVPALVFSNTLQNGLHLDDVYRVQENHELERVQPFWRHFVDARTSATLPHLVQYRPLLPLTLSLSVAASEVFGIDRLVSFHLGNLALHVATSLLLYFLFRELFLGWWRPVRPPRSPVRPDDMPFFAALLFAVHPISGVPINYICARDLQLMLLFLTASLLAYARMRRRGETPVRWAGVLAPLALSLLGKTNSAIAFAVVFAFELVVARTRLGDWKLWGRTALVGAVCGGFFLWTRALGFSDAEQLLIHRRPLEYPATQLEVHLFHYLGNFLWPFRMRPLPDVEPVGSPTDPGMWLGGVLVAGSLGLAWLTRRRSPLISFSILAYWLLFALTSSIFPLRSLATDYRQVPSLAFLCLGIAAAADHFRRFGTRTLVLLAMYFGVSAHGMNEVWRTDESLWGQSVRYGTTALGHMNYGLSVKPRDPLLAETHFERALELYPNHVYATINLGILYIDGGRAEEGLALVRRAVELNPSWALTHHWLARALGRLERWTEAMAASRRAVELDPRNAGYLRQAAWDCKRAGAVDDALAYLDRLAALTPDDVDVGFLPGFFLQQAGRDREAIERYGAFLAEHPDHVQARFNLAYAYKQAGEWARAIPHFERTLVAKPSYGEVHVHLAACYEALGDHARAAEHRAIYEQGR